MFEPNAEEVENVRVYMRFLMQGVTREEKEYSEKINEGLHIFDVYYCFLSYLQNVMIILQKLLQDEPCKWHIERKVYEQGWNYHFDLTVC